MPRLHRRTFVRVVITISWSRVRDGVVINPYPQEELGTICGVIRTTEDGLKALDSASFNARVLTVCTDGIPAAELLPTRGMLRGFLFKHSKKTCIKRIPGTLGAVALIHGELHFQAVSVEDMTHLDRLIVEPVGQGVLECAVERVANRPDQEVAKRRIAFRAETF